MFSIASTSKANILLWVKGKYGKIAANSVVGGQENYQQVYVESFKSRSGSLIPGKLKEGSTPDECAHFGVQTSNTYEILTISNSKQQIKWSKTTGTNIPEGALLVSMDGGYHRYSARIHHPSGSILLGKYIMPNGVFYYSYQGRELEATADFEVLCIA